MMDEESDRVRRLHQVLAGTIPCEPENVRSDLEAMELPELIFRYLDWADRFVRPAPRQVNTSSAFFRHGSPGPHLATLGALTAKIERGVDLRPFLSERVAKFGYVRPRVGKDGRRRGVEWDDKDYGLNAYETHHLHLDLTIGKDGWSGRTKQLLFVTFSRDAALFIMVGDHNSFDDGTLARAVAESRIGSSYEIHGIRGPAREFMDQERNRLQRYGFSTLSHETDGRHVVGAMLSSAGSNSLLSVHGNRWMRAIRDMDPQLDEPGFGREFFERSGKAFPASPAWGWQPHHSDLMLVETSTSNGFLVTQWRR